ncbi:hypothetical protein MS3_00001244 [Schistosoma haematobium]|uniref:Uncharacterized protein n=2 Tax=Schistosoma haematobium TaxID=6185 RepID=A0A6A5DIE5_SCHHA|nr:hypothetical protein MS3_00001243 [Schistosoma haematobium]XP_051073283.1 hypothetical protein MS3_00003891 [Schistosoma haematobium]XP_051073284.1 hypothetical protein MS3_00001244 [Schistosoma haematobium]KAH9594104.1 hypothetical protein MS3_00001243 [Schistosoma haematobium]KAH9594105.1 hypothetical protein MS3_00003891 [Schistosoma haematobium]KAH9594106.1 hypothetical protein MS3_00001244 [Schistosoma haematobium]
MRLVFILLLNVFLFEQLLTKPMPFNSTIQYNQGVDGSKPNIVFIDDEDDKFNFQHAGNLDPSNSQLRPENHDIGNPNPPNYTPERYLEMINRNVGQHWYPGVRRPDIGQYYRYY